MSAPVGCGKAPGKGPRPCSTGAATRPDWRLLCVAVLRGVPPRHRVGHRVFASAQEDTGVFPRVVRECQPRHWVGRSVSARALRDTGAFSMFFSRGSAQRVSAPTRPGVFGGVSRDSARAHVHACVRRIGPGGRGGAAAGRRFGARTGVVHCRRPRQFRLRGRIAPPAARGGRLAHQGDAIAILGNTMSRPSRTRNSTSPGSRWITRVSERPKQAAACSRERHWRGAAPRACPRRGTACRKGPHPRPGTAAGAGVGQAQPRRSRESKIYVVDTNTRPPYGGARRPSDADRWDDDVRGLQEVFAKSAGLDAKLAAFREHFARQAGTTPFAPGVARMTPAEAVKYFDQAPRGLHKNRGNGEAVVGFRQVACGRAVRNQCRADGQNQVHARLCARRRSGGLHTFAAILHQEWGWGGWDPTAGFSWAKLLDAANGGRVERERCEDRANARKKKAAPKGPAVAGAPVPLHHTHRYHLLLPEADLEHVVRPTRARAVRRPILAGFLASCCFTWGLHGNSGRSAQQ